MSAYGISNAMVALVIIAVLHGLLTRFRGAVGATRTAKADGAGSQASGPPRMETFADSFIRQPPVGPSDSGSATGEADMREMIEFANSNESWAACRMDLYEGAASSTMERSPCLRQEAALTHMTLVNSYEDEAVSNGAEIAAGLRGFEDWGPSGSFSPVDAPPPMI
jgi:hypothetical protein